MTNVRAIICVSIAAALLTGCTDSTNESATPQSTPHASIAPTEATTGIAVPVITSEVVKDQSTWSLPTDPFFTGRELEMLYLYAHESIVVPCMHEGGFGEYSQRWDYGAPGPENLAGDKHDILFTPVMAAKYGYHMAPDPSDLFFDSLIATGSLYQNESEAFLTQWDACSQRAMDELMTDSERAFYEQQEAAGWPTDDQETALSSISSQLNRLVLDTTSDPTLVASALQWRECMAPLGIIDLPSEPWAAGAPHAMPESLQAQWDWTSYGAPTPEEIEFAVHDAECRTSSGWADHLYEAEWKMREEFVSKNHDELEPILEEHREQATHYAKLIEEYSAK